MLVTLNSNPFCVCRFDLKPSCDVQYFNKGCAEVQTKKIQVFVHKNKMCSEIITWTLPVVFLGLWQMCKDWGGLFLKQ